jgi:hypothetical protein
VKISSRLKRLERKFDLNESVWVIFNINYYENADERKMAYQRLICDYVSNGNRSSGCYVFINEIPCPSAEVRNKESFLSSFRA